MPNLSRGQALDSEPWRRRTPDGIYFGVDGSVWAYFEIPLLPLKHEDAEVRLGHGSGLESVLRDLGDTSVDVANGVSALAQLREFQLFGATFDTVHPMPATKTELHREWLLDVLPDTAPGKCLLIGVRLWNNVRRSLARGGGVGVSGQLLKQTKSRLSRDPDSVETFENYRDDYADIADIMRRGGAGRPRPAALARLESWFNQGNGPTVKTLASDTEIHVSHASSYELSVVTKFTRTSLSAPDAQWLMDAMSHERSPAVAVSIRADLMPASLLRTQLRAAQRKWRAAEEEEAKTGDLGRDETAEGAALAKSLEDFVRSDSQAWLSGCSIVMAREYSAHEDQSNTFRDALLARYGVETKALENRQLELLAEMQPAGRRAANPFSQVLSLSMLAYAGAAAFSNVGDPTGAWMGQVDPDGAPWLIDPDAAHHRNLPPVMAIFGDPGSGKSLSVDAPVLTPQGWVPIGSLQVGDQVVGRDGTAHQVLGVYPQGVLPLYDVRFCDGAHVEASGNHLWEIADEHGTRLVTTDELREQLLDADAQARPTIPVAAAYERPDVAGVDDPYLSGLLLAASDTTPRPAATSPGAARMRDLPEVLVAHGSIAQRLAWLSGIADVAGEPAGPGQLVVATRDERLACQIRTLALSLGAVASLPKGSETFVVTLTLPAALGCPFRLAPHVARWQPAPAAELRRGVAEVAYSRDADAVCIAVSAPDNLFVTDEYVVTHNTFAMQVLCLQAAMAGKNVFLINPKGHSSLQPVVNYLLSQGVPARRISMQSMESVPGAFDPFSFADPRLAAEILNRHILTALGSSFGGGLTPAQEIDLGAGLARGAEAGARCAAQALAYVEDPVVRDLVLKQVEASTLFRLGFGFEPRSMGDAAAGLTLVEFDRKLDLPGPGVAPGRDERIALAALRLVTRASMETLLTSGGGVLGVDEAHHYVNSPEGLASLQSTGREGRSQGLFPIFATQRVSDLQNAEMDGYLSRVLAMKLQDPVQARIALELCKLKPTPERIEFLRECGPRTPSNGEPGGPAFGYLRDLDNRHAVVTIGPLPEELRLALSTNKQDAALRDEQAAAADPTDPEDLP